MCVFFLVVIMTACETKTPTNKKTFRISSAYCECAATLGEMDKMARTIPDSLPAFGEHLERMQQEYDKTYLCLTPVLTEMGKVQPSEITALQAEIKTKCPDLAGNTDLLKELLCR
jgi:ribosomal protein S18